MINKAKALERLQSDWKRYMLFKKTQLKHMNNDMNRIALKIGNGRKNNASEAYMLLYRQEYEQVAVRLKRLKQLLTDLEMLDEEIKQGKVKVKWHRDINGRMYCSYLFENKNSVRGRVRNLLDYDKRDNK